MVFFSRYRHTLGRALIPHIKENGSYRYIEKIDLIPYSLLSIDIDMVVYKRKWLPRVRAYVGLPAAAGPQAYMTLITEDPRKKIEMSINPARTATQSGALFRWFVQSHRLIGMHLSAASTCACRGQQPYHFAARRAPI